MSKLSRTKGKVGEREVANLLRTYGWPARRGQQRSGIDQADVIGGPVGWHFEVKRTAVLALKAALEQAKNDAGPHQEPVVVHRPNGRPWVAVVDLEAFLGLLATAERWLAHVRAGGHTPPA